MVKENCNDKACDCDNHRSIHENKTEMFYTVVLICLHIKSLFLKRFVCLVEVHNHKVNSNSNNKIVLPY